MRFSLQISEPATLEGGAPLLDESGEPVYHYVTHWPATPPDAVALFLAHPEARIFRHATNLEEHGDQVEPAELLGAPE